MHMHCASIVVWFRLGAAIVATVVAACFATESARAQNARAQAQTKRLLVCFADGLNPAEAATDLARDHGLHPGYVFQRVAPGMVIATPARATLAALRADPRVKLVEPDLPVRAFSDPQITTGFDRIDADLALAINGIDDDGCGEVDVAILDTGLHRTHADLNIDPNGIRFYSSGPFRVRSDTAWDDGDGHGTHVAGIVGAIDNAIGVVGVAAGARLTAIKVLADDGSGYVSGIVAGLDWMVAQKDADGVTNRFEVANLSLGSTYSATFNAAVADAVRAGIVVVAAAGNEAQNVSNTSPGSEPLVITVSALADFDGIPGALYPRSVAFQLCTVSGDDIFACFSNFGSSVDICAPGVLIRSTWNDGGYETISGTSQASPYVAGAAALYVARNGLTRSEAGVADVRDALVMSGWGSADDAYFTGDTDGTAEPLLDVLSLAGPPPSDTVTVKPSDMQGWTVQQTNTASYAFIDGPGTTPEGAGSFSAQTGDGTGYDNGTGLGGKVFLSTAALDGVRLADLSALSYATYVDPASTAVGHLAPALNLNVDIDGDGDFDTIMVFEPVYVPEQGAVTAGTWQTWDTLAGRWWFVQPTSSFCALDCFVQLSDILDAHPNATLIADGGLPGFSIVSGQRSGGIWAGFSGSVDAVDLDGVVYDFEAD
jgi:subtilisin family serine protease